MRKTILAVLLSFISINLCAQGSFVVTGGTKGDKFYVASLPKNGTSNYHKLRIDIFGGNWHDSNLGTRTYSISSRRSKDDHPENLIRINQEQRGGAVGKYTLKVYETLAGYDFVLETTDYFVSILVQAWLSDIKDYGVVSPVSVQEIKPYTVGSNVDITDTEKVQFINIFTTDNSGNIGIGTENPTEKLDVDGNVKVGLHSENWSGYGNRLTLSGVGDNTDDMWLSKYCRGNNMTDLRVNIGDDPNGDPNGTDRFVIGTTTPYNSTNWLSHFTVESSGNVGIGTENPQTKLDVAGTIRAKEVKIEATGWADFVFDKSYNLPKLSDVEKHINDRQHLPGIPSEKEVLENGVNVVDMQAKLLQKIEELTLYVIDLKKENEKQDNQNKDLQQQVNELKARLNEKQP